MVEITQEDRTLLAVLNITIRDDDALRAIAARRRSTEQRVREECATECERRFRLNNGARIAQAIRNMGNAG